MKRLGALGLLAVASWTVGCGGGAVPPHCDQVEPCGGDIVGAWKFAGACENTTAANMNLAMTCPGGAINALSISVSGGLAFNSDMTYTTTGVTAAIRATETVPLSCTNAASCAAVTTTLSNTTVSCTGTTNCTCTVASTNLASNGVLGGTTSGTYTISANTLTLQTATSTSSNSYCVQGSELHFMSVDTTTNMGPMGMATIRSDLVALKQ
jgi:hypothetical protein